MFEQLISNSSNILLEFKRYINPALKLLIMLLNNVFLKVIVLKLLANRNPPENPSILVKFE